MVSNTMLVEKLLFDINNLHFKELDTFYNKIFTENIQSIDLNGYEFNNASGDITKDIYWTWVSNNKSMDLFTKFFNDINLVDKLNKLFNNTFHIIGVSYITINKNEILDKDSEFHYDILSQYDLPEKTNILTVLIPMKYEMGMGGLQYINDKIINYYYKFGECIIFDSSKVKHRTMPFKIENKKKRVLISINLSSNLEWAINVTKNNTKCQGNLYTKYI